MTISRRLKLVVAVMITGMAITLPACSNQPVNDDKLAEPSTQLVSSQPQGFAEIKQAAAQGDVGAQYQLGLWYEEDHAESPRDMVRAYAWYKLAANQGDFGSKYAMERFEAQLTNEDRFTAEELVERWKPGDTLEK